MSSSTPNAGESLEHVGRLRETVKEGIDHCNAAITQKQTERGEYETLKGLLQELPKSLSREIMIPCGTVGYLPGKIEHTNEIMVLLGENIFAERTAFQACEIVDRRIKALDDIIRDVQSEKRLLNDQLKFADQLFTASGSRNDEVEIREEYDEDNEKKLKEKRRKAAACKNVEQEVSKEDHNALMARLDALELLEKGEPSEDVKNGEAEEKITTDDEVSIPAGVDPDKYRELLARVDAMCEESSDENDEDEEEDDEEGLDSDDIPEEEEETCDVSSTANTKLKPSKSDRRGSRVRFPSELEAGPSGADNAMACPSDATQVKSILKCKEPTPIDRSRVGEIERQDTDSRSVVPGSASAFPGQILERDYLAIPSTSGETSQEEPKKVSKFKQMRSSRTH